MTKRTFVLILSSQFPILIQLITAHLIRAYMDIVLTQNMDINASAKMDMLEKIVTVRNLRSHNSKHSIDSFFNTISTIAANNDIQQRH